MIRWLFLRQSGSLLSVYRFIVALFDENRKGLRFFQPFSIFCLPRDDLLLEKSGGRW